MSMSLRKGTAVVLGTGLLVAGLGPMTGRVSAGYLPGAMSPRPDGNRLSPEGARLYAAVKSARPGELRWQQIPWLVDLQEGIRSAREENRPLLLFVSGDDPLEKC